jgi:hypothetical protein
MFRSLFAIAYLVVGGIVANAHHYLAHLNALKPIGSAVLAVVVWPAVLAGVNLHL